MPISSPSRLCGRTVFRWPFDFNGHRGSPHFIYYDALPLTHPAFFPRFADLNGTVTRYHQAVARAENVAFISPAIRRLFEQRLARRRLPSAIVVRPGADGLPRVKATVP